MQVSVKGYNSSLINNYELIPVLNEASFEEITLNKTRPSINSTNYNETNVNSSS